MSVVAFFQAVTRAPKLMLVLGIALIACTCAGLGQLVKDTSVDAFIPPDHPSILANDQAKEIFGLSDPIVVALISKENGNKESASNGIFEPQHLETIATLHQAIAVLPNVRADRVMSLESESSITGFSDRIDIDRYLDDISVPADIRSRWQTMPPHLGTLVSDDGRGAVIVAELDDQHQAGATYDQILALLEQTELHGLEPHVAGQGAISGHLSSYIDTDSRRLQPTIFVIVLVVLFLSFRTLAAAGLPLLIIIGSAGGAVGIMAFNGVPYFAITSALPVILVAVAVADTIHILTAYYIRRAQQSDPDTRTMVVNTMTDMFGPISVTTLTTVAGFSGIAIAEIMPPVVQFAIYAAVGVLLAWVYSILILPNVMVLVAPKPSPQFRNWTRDRPDRIGRAFTRIGLVAATRPLHTLGLAIAFVALAGYGASHVRIDRAQVEGFKAATPIRIADEQINARFAGTSFLDVMIRSEAPEGLLQASAMQRISALQAYMEALPHVQHSMAITDYISLLHQAMEQQPAASGARPLPAEDDAIAQYLLVYEASGDPSDFEEEIDGDYQIALVRGIMNTRYFSQERATVERLQRYLDQEFNGNGLSATLSGRVNVRYHWMVRLAEHHLAGVALSLFLVFVIAALLFRSVAAGALSVLPVSMTVLGLYAVMGTANIYLEPATTMFAAISLGVGVDFAIHLVARLRKALWAADGDLVSAINSAMPETARACFFNAMALGIGFSVLLFSELLTLKRFGGMVSVAATLSFIAALILIPAVYGLAARTRGWLKQHSRKPAQNRTAAVCLLLGTGLLGLTLLPTDTAVAAPAVPLAGAASGASPGLGDTSLDGAALASKIAKRPSGDYMVRQINMSMTDRRGKVRAREALILRANSAEERRTLIVYLGPKAVRETAFLGYDYEVAGKNDDQWLYLPAMRKVRRIPSSDRGDYFLGTDFTYEDMQSELKFDLDDYDFVSKGLSADGQHYRLSGTPRSAAIAKELGYGGFHAEVHRESWIPTRIEFLDSKGQPLKTIEVARLEQIEGFWTALEVSATHHQKQHVTRFDYADIRYPTSLPAELFAPNNLRRGVPSL